MAYSVDNSVSWPSVSAWMDKSFASLRSCSTLVQSASACSTRAMTSASVTKFSWDDEIIVVLVRRC